jgi:hypothetical protein
MRRKLVAALVAAAALVTGIAGEASALTVWQNFGYAEGRGVGRIGRDEEGNLIVDQVAVYVESTTKANPARLRFRVRGTGRAAIAWYLGCWNGPGNAPDEYANIGTREAPITRMRLLPFTLDLSERLGGIRNWNRCSLGVAAVSLREGYLRVSEQARY